MIKNQVKTSKVKEARTTAARPRAYRSCPAPRREHAAQPDTAEEEAALYTTLSTMIS